MNDIELIVTDDLRNNLKALIQREIEELPAILNDLSPSERLSAIFKLMPYVFPKVQNVNISQGEPLW